MTSTTLYIDRASSTRVTRVGSGKWDNDDTYTSWELGDVWLQKDSAESYNYEMYELDQHADVGDIVYVVFAVWSTGDSFGSYEGAGAEVMFVSKDPDVAYFVMRTLQNATGYSEKITWNNGQTRPIHIPWNGYFEQLNSLTVYERIVG